MDARIRFVKARTSFLKALGDLRSELERLSDRIDPKEKPSPESKLRWNDLSNFHENITQFYSLFEDVLMKSDPNHAPATEVCDALATKPSQVPRTKAILSYLIQTYLPAFEHKIKISEQECVAANAEEAVKECAIILNNPFRSHLDPPYSPPADWKKVVREVKLLRNAIKSTFGQRSERHLEEWCTQFSSAAVVLDKSWRSIDPSYEPSANTTSIMDSSSLNHLEKNQILGLVNYFADSFLLEFSAMVEKFGDDAAFTESSAPSDVADCNTLFTGQYLKFLDEDVELSCEEVSDANESSSLEVREEGVNQNEEEADSVGGNQEELTDDVKKDVKVKMEELTGGVKKEVKVKMEELTGDVKKEVKVEDLTGDVKKEVKVEELTGDVKKEVKVKMEELTGDVKKEVKVEELTGDVKKEVKVEDLTGDVKKDQKGPGNRKRKDPEQVS